jgi:psp operon transcriptional activator
VERSVYRWGDQDTAVDQVVINPFNSFAHDGTSSLSGTQMLDGHTQNNQAAEPAESHDKAWPTDLREKLQAIERDWLVCALEESKQSQKIAAQLLGLSYDQMRSLMRKHSLRTRPGRGE